MNNTGRLLIVALGMALLATCHQSILTAPPGSMLDMQANPRFIPANGGVSVITALVYDATGQPVADGTVVQFFTDLGRIQEQGKTNDGVARVNLVADGRSGKATVQGKIGGGAAPAPSPTPTPTSTITPGAASSPAPLGLGGTAAESSVAAAAAVATFDGKVEVDIGTVLPKLIFLAADPRNIAADGPRFTTLTATVFDERGNPVGNVPVVFKIEGDTDFTESLQSGGQPVFTDNNGQARDQLWTSWPRFSRSQTVNVLAAAATGGTAALQSTLLTVGINF